MNPRDIRRENCSLISKPLADSRRNASYVCTPPAGCKFYHFYAIFEKKMQNNKTLEVGAPHENPRSM